MPWNEPSPDEAQAGSVTAPAVMAIVVALASFFVLLLLPLALGSAWYCWWRCRRSAETHGLGVTIAALLFSHLALGVWLLQAGLYFAGGLGVFLVLLALCGYGLFCTVFFQSPAWKYALCAICVFVVAMSFISTSINAVRNDANRNRSHNSLRQLGFDLQKQENLRTNPYGNREAP